MKTFLIYENGKRVGQCAGNKKSAKQWIKENLWSTHMGQWIKVNGVDLHYHTTIGKTFCFMRDGKPVK